MLPETFDFIAEFAARAKRSSIEVLVECTRTTGARSRSPSASIWT